MRNYLCAFLVPHFFKVKLFVVLPETEVGAYLIGDCLGPMAARSPPPGGHLLRRPVQELYLKQEKTSFSTTEL